MTGEVTTGTVEIVVWIFDGATPKSSNESVVATASFTLDCFCEIEKSSSIGIFNPD